MEGISYVTIEQFCAFHRIETVVVEELAEHGIFQPSRQEQELILIASQDLPRLEKAIRLHRDLGVNAAGIDIILNLLDRLEGHTEIEEW